MTVKNEQTSLIFLEKGDTFSCIDGTKAICADIKRVNIVATIIGKEGLYNIPKRGFLKIIKKAEVKEKKIDLKPGELFYIEKCLKAILYRYASHNSRKIYATSILNNSQATIDIELYGGAVKDL